MNKIVLFLLFIISLELAAQISISVYTIVKAKEQIGQTLTNSIKKGLESL